MSVISFASLKGGVGKTSLTVNVGHAFARRGCSTLIIDLDPSAHATRLFKSSDKAALFPAHPPLARTFLAKAMVNPGAFYTNGEEESFVVPVRDSLEIIPGGAELRYFLPAHGARYFAKGFPGLIEELKVHFDHILIDTPPDYNVLTRNAIAQSDVVVAPIDSSEMSIASIEELLICSHHLKRPVWALMRTMVNSKARCTHALTNNRLKNNLLYSDASPATNADGANENFMDLLRGGWHHLMSGNPGVFDAWQRIFLLDSVMLRTDYQNQLSFLGKTSFDLARTAALSRQYLAVARELEELISQLEEEKLAANPLTANPMIGEVDEEIHRLAS